MANHIGEIVKTAGVHNTGLVNDQVLVVKYDGGIMPGPNNCGVYVRKNYIVGDGPLPQESSATNTRRWKSIDIIFTMLPYDAAMQIGMEAAKKERLVLLYEEVAPPDDDSNQRINMVNDIMRGKGSEVPGKYFLEDDKVSSEKDANKQTNQQTKIIWHPNNWKLNEG